MTNGTKSRACQKPTRPLGPSVTAKIGEGDRDVAIRVVPKGRIFLLD